MRIALVSPYDLAVPGGVQSHVEQLAAALTALGDDVEIVGPGPGHGHRSVGGSTGIPFNDSVAPIALDPRAAGRTVRTLRDLDPDVVHVHEPAVPWVSLGACLRGPTPIVGTFHAWSSSNRAYRLARPLLRRAVRRLDQLTAVSPAAAAYHAKALGLPEGRFRLVPNGVDVARFSDAEPLPEIVEDDHETLLFVGRLEPRKGLSQLVHAFIELKATRPGLRLLVVGEGPERDVCQALLPGRLRSDVVFLGRVDQDDLPRFYRSADVYVSPALGGESFGIVLLEAMAAGTPVVASDIPGYRTVLSDGKQGRLVPPRDVKALAAALGALLDNPALREAMAREGQRTVDGYDWTRVAAQVRDVYAVAVS